MGNRDGYSAANWVAVMFGSYIDSPQDVNALRTGQLKWNDAKMVTPLERYSQLWADGLTNPDARTREQVDANSDFISGKAAMVLFYSSPIPDFRKGIGKALGLMKLPPSGPGPLNKAMNINTGQVWALPKDGNTQAGWDFIKVITDAKSQSLALKLASNPPANNQSDLSVVKDPILREFVKLLSEKPQFVLLDSVVDPQVASVWYKELAVAFAGRQSAKEAMDRVQQAADRMA
jgi:raffinose/stachyose/melibiose transport system substrate-binding protein